MCFDCPVHLKASSSNVLRAITSRARYRERDAELSFILLGSTYRSSGHTNLSQEWRTALKVVLLNFSFLHPPMFFFFRFVMALCSLHSHATMPSSCVMGSSRLSTSSSHSHPARKFREPLTLARKLPLKTSEEIQTQVMECLRADYAGLDFVYDMWCALHDEEVRTQKVVEQMLRDQECSRSRRITRTASLLSNISTGQSCDVPKAPQPSIFSSYMRIDKPTPVRPSPLVLAGHNGIPFARTSRAGSICSHSSGCSPCVPLRPSTPEALKTVDKWLSNVDRGSAASSRSSSPRRTAMRPPRSQSSRLLHGLSRPSTPRKKVSSISSVTTAGSSANILHIIKRLPPIPGFNPFIRARAESMSSIIDLRKRNSKNNESTAVDPVLITRPRSKSDTGVLLRGSQWGRDPRFAAGFF
ncbi:hypothetical protein A0H81_11452 [Grifola frondosa]|uniref:Uncharacterized protein n=1 Tax=Grifola frondosa TaxID=5627 RepID=A0A1C7M0I2_GRIFR|nr:hypothetical protein A0H81_11452 [Grifola frondosa]